MRYCPSAPVIFEIENTVSLNFEFTTTRVIIIIIVIIINIIINLIIKSM